MAGNERDYVNRKADSTDFGGDESMALGLAKQSIWSATPPRGAPV